MTALKLPYFKAGSQIGCLLIHGFTSTPAELRLIGEGLARVGYTTNGILLAGHGTQPEDLLPVTYEDWIESAQQGINQLKKSCKKIIVIGHSMGGLLALQMAARNKIDGVVTIAAALKPANRKAYWAWLFKYFQTYTSLPGKEWPPEQQQYLLHYPYFPVASVAELQRLAAHTRGILPQITTDILIVQTKDDTTVRPESAEIIAQRISSKRKECLWLEEGTHSVPVVPPYNAQIVTRIDEFIQNL
jgi:carboxylesterase